MEILKVSATSKPVAVAGAIAGVVRTAGKVEVQGIGAGAVNQAVKAIAIARGYLAPGGIDLVCVPSFVDLTINNEARTASACWSRFARQRAQPGHLDHRLGRRRQGDPRGCWQAKALRAVVGEPSARWWSTTLHRVRSRTRAATPDPLARR